MKCCRLQNRQVVVDTYTIGEVEELHVGCYITLPHLKHQCVGADVVERGQ